MSRFANSFALLLDEEDDDMNVLAENIAKKVEISAPPPPQPETKIQGKNKPFDGAAPPGGNLQGKSFQPNENVRGDRGQVRESQGRGFRRGGYAPNDAGQFRNDRENGYRRNYYDEGLNGNGFNAPSRGRGRGRGGGRGRGRGRDGVFYNDDVSQHEKGNELVLGSEEKLDADAPDAGWENIPQSNVKGYRGEGRGFREDKRTFRNGNQGYGGDRSDGFHSYGNDRNYGGDRSDGYHSYSNDRNYGGDRRRAPRQRQDTVNDRTDEQTGNLGVEEAVQDVDKVPAKENTDGNPEQKDAEVTEVPKIADDDSKAEDNGKEVDSVKNVERKNEEEEDNYMTLEEYEKLLSEKRKALEALKNEERKVDLDKDFEAMQLVGKKKEDESIFVKLKSDKEKLKKKESLEKEEKGRKVVSINEFLKPAEGEEPVFRRGGRTGGGRGRGEQRGGGGFRNGNVERYRNGEGEQQGGGRSRYVDGDGQGGGRFRNGGAEQQGGGGGYRSGGGYGGRGGRTRDAAPAAAISIEDPGQFPVLGGAAV